MVLTEIKGFLVKPKSSTKSAVAKKDRSPPPDFYQRNESVQPNSCCGTEEGVSVWCNSSDSTGLFLGSFVWFLLLYSGFMAVLLTFDADSDLAAWIGNILIVLVIMSLWSHAATMLGDPGAVPHNAKSISVDEEDGTPSLCGRCDAYKPPGSHHDRVSDRCISRMDHFCPWTNNAIGAKNQKNFFLFLIYTNLASIFMYVLLGLNLVQCKSLDCRDHSKINSLLVRLEILVSLFAIIFTTSMIVTQIFGLVSGLGTIDRMKLKRGQLENSKPIPFNHVFGDSAWRWFIPVDPYFMDSETVFQYRIAGQ